MKTKLKYIRIEEKKSKYSKDIYYGIFRSKSDNFTTAMVVKPNCDKPWIYVDEFPEKDFDITEASMEDVKHFFKKAFVQTEKELDEAEFDLRDKKRNMITATERFDEYF